jgi:drug/metabolite transporter (DMT)-like permease
MAMIWQLVIFAEPPGFWTIAGASLIIGSTVMIAQVTQRSSRVEPAIE